MRENTQTAIMRRFYNTHNKRMHTDHIARYAVNVTGDAFVSMLVAKTVGKLGEPKVKDWDDNYKK